MAGRELLGWLRPRWQGCGCCISTLSLRIDKESLDLDLLKNDMAARTYSDLYLVKLWGVDD